MNVKMRRGDGGNRAVVRTNQKKVGLQYKKGRSERGDYKGRGREFDEK